MINNLANRLTEKLLSTGSISEDEQELYIYGFFMLLSSLMYLILACFLGLVFGCIAESLVFFIAFQFIRRYAGGYHAKTEIRCTVASSLSMAICIAVINLSKLYTIKNALLILALISAACILFLCPIDTPEKPLSQKERRYFRKISWAILIGLLATVLISYIHDWSVLFAPCCMTLVLESVLLVAASIKQQVAKRNKRAAKKRDN